MRADATSATAPGTSCGRARCRPLRAGQVWAGRVVTSATSPGPLCGWARCRPPLAGQARAGRSSPQPPAPAPVLLGRCSLCSLSPGRRRALPISQWSWVSAGLPVGAPDHLHASPLMSQQGAAVGRGQGWRSSGWIAISTVQGAAGPWSRAYHWHVCWAGVLCAPDRQQRAAASAQASPGRAQPSPAAARLGRCGPRDRPAADLRPGARLDRGLGVYSSMGSLRSR
jgi:hypothetical protein